MKLSLSESVPIFFLYLICYDYNKLLEKIVNDHFVESFVYLIYAHQTLN